MFELPHRQLCIGARSGNIRMAWIRYLVEPIHVQLSHKTGHIPMLEVPGEGVRKLFTGTECKRIAVLIPSPPDKIRELRVVQHRIKFMNKRIFLNRGLLPFTHFS